MSTKTKTETKVALLKGQEAEDAVLNYLQQMNRPYGAVDVSANLKGAVPKTAAQKILLTLAEKGDLIQKTYGKTTFFVINQAKIKSIPPEDMAGLELEYQTIEAENKVLMAEVRTASSELTKLKSTATDAELETQLTLMDASINQLQARVVPLRSGAPPISPADLAQIDMDWIKWRAEWIRRKKVFMTFWQLATDALPPQDAEDLAEDLGIEMDTPEHHTLERSPLCVHQKCNGSLKRKR
ncbi:TBPIP-domain-containing protein [Infundibulicybe gibba]|nr:TBPIP-domain-containing protein [Infundibulicybe gibba]